MNRLAALALALALPAAAAQAAPKAAAKPRVVTVTVVMKDRHFRPDVIRLTRNRPYRLLLVNDDVSGHNFDARGFLDSCDDVHASAPFDGGLVSIPSQSTVELFATPRIARPFDLKSSVALDVASGMKGQILVY